MFLFSAKRPAPAWLLAAAVSVVGCGDGSDTDDAREGPLVHTSEPGAWIVVDDPDEDAFASRRPGTIDCGISGWFVEEDGTEVDTGVCNYLTLRQPSLIELRKGDRVRVEFFHFDLTSPEPAIGFAAIAVGNEVVWSYQTPIPKPAAFFDEEVEIGFDAPAGTPVSFHVDNHGQNTWKLAVVELVP